MKTSIKNTLKQHAKVARTFYKTFSAGTNSRIRPSAITPGLDFQTINNNI